MQTLIIILLILLIAVGTLLFILGYGTLFVSAFSGNKKISVVLLILLGFSSVGFVLADKPWYYALPLWLVPAFYAQISKVKDARMKRAMLWFWVGLFCLAIGLVVMGYFIFQYADLNEMMSKFKEK